MCITCHFGKTCVLNVIKFLSQPRNIWWIKDTSNGSFEMFCTVHLFITFSPEQIKHKQNTGPRGKQTHLQEAMNHRAFKETYPPPPDRSLRHHVHSWRSALGEAAQPDTAASGTECWRDCVGLASVKLERDNMSHSILIKHINTTGLLR